MSSFSAFAPSRDRPGRHAWRRARHLDDHDIRLHRVGAERAQPREQRARGGLRAVDEEDRDGRLGRFGFERALEPRGKKRRTAHAGRHVPERVAARDRVADDEDAHGLLRVELRAKMGKRSRPLTKGDRSVGRGASGSFADLSPSARRAASSREGPTARIISSASTVKLAGRFVSGVTLKKIDATRGVATGGRKSPHVTRTGCQVVVVDVPVASGESLAGCLTPPEQLDRLLEASRKYRAYQHWSRIRLGSSEKPITGQGFNAVKFDPRKPARTVRRNDGNLGMHGAMHWTECRRFSLPEFKRFGIFSG